jgi:signal transduction histidine kinase
MARLEISDGLYQQLTQQADDAGLPLEDWLAITTAPELQTLYAWFFGLMGHDLRAPLTTIVTSSEILKYYQARLTEEHRIEHLDTIQSQVFSLTGLLTNVRALQKLALGRLRCDAAPRDLADFAGFVCREVRSMVNNSHPINIMTADGPMTFSLDEKLARLALLNILLNATQFSPPAAPVQLQLTITPHRAIITVTDSGIGIPADEQAHVFDLYYRASNVPDKLGKGLGLTVAQRVMALHNGSISLSSAVGEGTTVSIHIPR